MRNYIEVFSQWFEVWDRTDPMNPVITGLHRQFSASQEEAEAYSQAITHDDGTQIVYYVVAEAMKTTWFLQNKTIFLNILNNTTAINAAAEVYESPRQPASLPTWPNNDGNPKGPTYNVHLGDEKRFAATTGNFSGANGLFDALNAMLLLVAALLKEGRKRDAGIVQYAYDRVIDETFTLTEALAYISKNVNL